MEKINRIPYKSSILIAPLDWGLGHATRCIPIISELLIYECNITIVASGASKELLQKEFPQLSVITIKGYNVRYSRKKWKLPFILFWQFPKICIRILQEQSWLKKWVKNNTVDLIISDNRLGLYHRNIPAIYITHQLKIKTGNIFTDWVAQKIHYHFINKYTCCWVPDNKYDNNLAGELSHPKKLPSIPVNYIGTLSRLERIEITNQYDLLFIISGPEPQRTIFENLILKELENYQGTALIVRGVPNGSEIKYTKNNQVKIINHLTSSELNVAIAKSKLIISRSGYTTIMDMVKLQKQAVLVPTPGQTEQEYLADYLKQKKNFYTISQANFNLETIMQEVKSSFFSTPSIFTNEYKKIIQELFEQNNNQ